MSMWGVGEGEKKVHKKKCPRNCPRREKIKGGHAGAAGGEGWWGSWGERKKAARLAIGEGIRERVGVGSGA